MTARLPIVGSDDGTWGSILNDFLAVALNSDGTLQSTAIEQAGGITSVNGHTSTTGSVSLSSSDVGAYTKPVGGIPPTDLASSIQTDLTSIGSALQPNANGTTDWINIKEYGATGNGSTDDTAAIQSAINAASPGQTVYIPVGIYKTTAPITIPPFIVLRGSRGAVAAADVQNDNASVLQPASSWSSSLPMSGVITLLDCEAGSYTSYSGDPGTNSGVQIRDILIDGSKSPASVDGIAAYGGIDALRLDGIGMNLITGNGVNALGNTTSGLYADGWHVTHCIVQNITGGGFFGQNLFNDSFYLDVHVQSAGGDGFQIISGGARLVNCRADYCNNGYTIDQRSMGSAGFAPVMLTSCSCDLNSKNDLNVIATRSGNTGGLILVANCEFAGAGSSGSGYAGIWIAGGANVWISNTSVMTAVTNSAIHPDYGILTNATNGVPSYVNMTSGLLMGNLAAWDDAAPSSFFNIGSNVATLVGTATTTSPLVINNYADIMNGKSVTLQAGTSTGNMLQVTNTTSGPSNPPFQQIAAAAGDNTYGIKVSGDANNRFKIASDGKHNWGPGNATQDTDLYRNATSELKTDNNLTVANNLTVGGAALTAGGAGVVGLLDATTAPTSTPSGGGILYGSGGEPYWLDSGGNTWNLAQNQEWQATDLGYTSWAFDPAVLGGNGNTPTAGVLTLIGVKYRIPVTVSTIYLWLHANGTDLSNNYVGLYAQTTGNLLGYSSDQSSSWGSGAPKKVNVALTAQSAGSLSLVPGIYWVAVLCNFTVGGTTPSFGYSQNIGANLVNGTAGVASSRYATNGAGLTALPTSITTSGNAAAQISYWAAVQ